MITTRLLDNERAERIFEKLSEECLENSSNSDKIVLRELLNELKETGICEDEDDEKIFTLSNLSQIQYYFFLEKMKKHHCVLFNLHHKDEIFSSLIPQASDAAYHKNLEIGKNLQLNEFFLLRIENGKWVLETPLSAMKIVLHSSIALHIIEKLVKPMSFDELKSVFSYLDEKILKNFLIYLKNAEVLEEKPELIQWEFHDLYFHARSRIGRHNNPTGAHFPFKGKIPAPPIFKERKALQTITLSKPEAPSTTLSFFDVLDKRKSIREPGNRIIHINELSEFLFYSARVKRLANTGSLDLSFRPYPNGGAIHELEIYPLISKCEGIESGFYRYDPLNHSLESYPYDPSEFQLTFLHSKQSMDAEAIPQILFIIAARFNRVSWKYRSITYSVILKNTGVLIQTMYLVATSLNLAPCANGSGDSDCFSKLSSLNYFDESSVGEFALSAL